MDEFKIWFRNCKNKKTFIDKIEDLEHRLEKRGITDVKIDRLLLKVYDYVIVDIDVNYWVLIYCLEVFLHMYHLSGKHLENYSNDMKDEWYERPVSRRVFAQFYAAGIHMDHLRGKILENYSNTMKDEWYERPVSTVALARFYAMGIHRKKIPPLPNRKRKAVLYRLATIYGISQNKFYRDFVIAEKAMRLEMRHNFKLTEKLIARLPKDLTI